jgi:hypothetical protein
MGAVTPHQLGPSPPHTQIHRFTASEPTLFQIPSEPALLGRFIRCAASVQAGANRCAALSQWLTASQPTLLQPLSPPTYCLLTHGFAVPFKMQNIYMRRAAGIGRGQGGLADGRQGWEDSDRHWIEKGREGGGGGEAKCSGGEAGWITRIMGISRCCYYFSRLVESNGEGKNWVRARIGCAVPFRPRSCRLEGGGVKGLAGPCGAEGVARL